MDIKSKNYFQHSKGTFNPEVLRDAKDKLEELSSHDQNDSISRRENIGQEYGLFSDNLRMNPLWYNCWKSTVTDLLDTFSPYTWLLYPPQVRYVRFDNNFVPWHQDLAYVKLKGEQGPKNFITCFIPINEKPYEHTTLQFYKKELDYIKHYTTGQPVNNQSLMINDPDNSRFVHFNLELGDCLLFRELTAHRTFTPPGTKTERTSLEFRLICPEDAIDGKDYFDIERGLYVQNNGIERQNI